MRKYFHSACGASLWAKIELICPSALECANKSTTPLALTSSNKLRGLRGQQKTPAIPHHKRRAHFRNIMRSVEVTDPAQQPPLLHHRNTIKLDFPIVEDEAHQVALIHIAQLPAAFHEVVRYLHILPSVTVTVTTIPAEAVVLHHLWRPGVELVAGLARGVL